MQSKIAENTGIIAFLGFVLLGILNIPKRIANMNRTRSVEPSRFNRSLMLMGGQYAGTSSMSGVFSTKRF